MNRIDRLNALRILLESRRLITAQELSEHFHLSLRTIYRDIKSLQEAGIGIEGEAGMGYRLSRHAQLSPIAFNSAEAISLLFAAKVVEHHLDTHHSQVFNSAITKIRSALPDSEKDTLERLESKVAIPLFGGQKQGLLDPEALHPIQNALVNSKQLEIQYFSNYRNTTNTRKVIPIGILFYSGYWHMIAWCKLRKDYRDFRIDRILNIQDLGPTIGEEKLKTLDQYLKEANAARSSVSQSQTQRLIECVILIHPKMYWLFERTRFRFGFVSQVLNTDGDYKNWTQARFFFDDLGEFGRWLLCFTNGVQIVSPSSLQEEYQKIASELKI